MVTAVLDEASIEQARALIPVIANATPADDVATRIPEESLHALEESGLFRLSVPRRLGGREASLSTTLQCAAAIAEGDGATGWVFSLIGVCDWMVGLFPESAQQDVFGADPSARVCGVIAPSATSTPAPGGLRVTGRWGWASGCLHSQWAVLGVPLVDAGGAQIDQGLVLVPMDQLDIEDTWHVTGMRGTGSNTLVATEIFVPEHRILSVSRAMKGQYGTEHEDEPLYRPAFVPTLAIVLAAPLVGIARSAFASVKDGILQGRGISHTFYEHAVDSGSTQSAIALAASRIDSASLHFERAGRDIDAAASAGELMSPLERARVRMDTAAIGDYCREAIELLMTIHGAGAFAESSSLQRDWRDAGIASRHAILNPLIAGELYGRALLGVADQVTPLI